MDIYEEHNISRVGTPNNKIFSYKKYYSKFVKLLASYIIGT